MVTSQDFIEFVSEQVARAVFFPVRYRKMFGEYMVYVADKPLLLICKNTVFVKIVACTTAILEPLDTPKDIPYTGSKEHYILDIENLELVSEVLTALEAVTPVPKPRKPKAPKTK